MNNGTDTKYFKENRLQGARTCSKGNARRLQVQVPSEELIAKRKAVRDSAVAAIIREQNDKWNAVIGIYEKNKVTCPLARNAIWRNWAKIIPSLDKYKR